MPCRDWEGVNESCRERDLQKDLEKKQKRLDYYAEMLCEQCKVLEVLDDDDVFTKEVKEWWTKHKIEDAKRIAIEQAEAERKKMAAEERSAKERTEKLTKYLQLKEELGL